MSLKDWLAGGSFVLMFVAVVVVVVLVLEREHSRHVVVHRAHEEQNLHLCYQNLGNGGC